ncbi:GreA/GreB family elongation factor [Candidatus Saccharibacteria bacterium]|nr:GreA/GreB family elongation factor [Candidatus Saccharibacteria bacterium]
MNTTTTILVSKKGMKELKKAVSHLTRQRQTIIGMIRELDKTDSHEQRLERMDKLAELDTVESQLADKQLQLSHAKLFPRKRDALKVALGSVVELIDTQGRLFRYQLVDSIEANPSDGRISTHSPLGQSLIGRTIQDTIRWGSGLQPRQLTLVAIH